MASGAAAARSAFVPPPSFALEPPRSRRPDAARRFPAAFAAVSARVRAGVSRGGHLARSATPPSVQPWTADDAGGVVFSAAELASATGGELVRSSSSGSVGTDTRSLRPGQWFLALSGESFDGDAFVGAALDAGCAGVISSKPMPPDWSAGYVRVDDALLALQSLASDVRRRFHGPVVAVTGSVGKTTTRSLVALALRGLGEVHETRGNFNNHVGVPLTLLRTSPSARACVLEMGMSGFGEIAALAEIAAPTVRAVTNVAAAHLEGVGGSLEGVAKAKGEMFAAAARGDVCVINADDVRVAAMEIPEGCRVASFGGAGSRADVEFGDVRTSLESTSFSLTFRGDDDDTEETETVRVTMRAPGVHLASCAACAAAVAFALGQPPIEIADALSRHRSADGRMRATPSNAYPGVTCVDDAYNASPASVENALRTLAVERAGGRRTAALLGDMLELGDAAGDSHADALRGCLDLGFDVVGVAGPHFAAALEKLREERGDTDGVFVGEDAEALWRAVRDAATREGTVALVKGSRGMGMDRVVRRLVEGEKQDER